MSRVLLIYRARRFSPNSVERDRAIMDAVADELTEQNPQTEIIRMSEEEADSINSLPEGIRICFSMARSEKVLRLLFESEKRGTVVINRPKPLLECTRSRIDKVMRSNKIPCAPLYTGKGWWLKRGDQSAQTRGDVVFAATPEERESAMKRFRERGITDVVTTGHVVGDVVKFYGVRHTGFFRHIHSADQGWSKFGDERHNGTAVHTPFDEENLKRQADRLASLLGTDVYGGDCIVRPEGTFAIIDFNDWPSFSAFRHEAAAAICRMSGAKGLLHEIK